MTARTALILILRMVGVVELTALFSMVMPHSWMATIHDGIGVAGGPLPETPIVAYLTRSLSAMYALLGALMVYFSLDVSANARSIRFLGAIAAFFGLCLYGIDIAAKLPIYWIAFEGTFVFGLGLSLYFLASRVIKTEAQPDQA